MFNSQKCFSALTRLAGNPYFEDVLSELDAEKREMLDRLTKVDPSRSVDVAKLQESVRLLSDFLDAADSAKEAARGPSFKPAAQY